MIVFGNLPYNISTELLCKWILNLDDNKICRYNNDANKEPFVYGGAIIISKYAFKNSNEDIFSINKIWNRSISNDRLMGYKNDSKIFHMGSIETFNIFNEK